MRKNYRIKERKKYSKLIILDRQTYQLAPCTNKAPVKFNTEIEQQIY